MKVYAAAAICSLNIINVSVLEKNDLEKLD